MQKVDKAQADFAIGIRGDALKRMAEMESADELNRVSLDEKLALSKAKTEAERLRITRDFAIRRVQIEANAQAQILLIERQVLEAQLGASSGKAADELLAKLAANSDALKSVGAKAGQAVQQIDLQFTIDSSNKTALDTIAGQEKALSDLQKELSEATSNDQREKIRERIKEHEDALLRMKYAEKQAVQDVIRGGADFLREINNLISQRAQNDFNAQKRAIDARKEAKTADLKATQEEKMAQLKAQHDIALEHARTAEERNKINQGYETSRANLSKQGEATQKVIDDQARAEQEAAQREMFDRQKAFSYIAAIINIAEAVTKALAAAPPPFSFVLAAMAAAAGAVQLAIISESEPPGMAQGGIFSGTGKVSGPGGPTDDMVNARLSNGEFVVNAFSTERNLHALNAINDMNLAAKVILFPEYAEGGEFITTARAARSAPILLNLINGGKLSDNMVVLPINAPSIPRIQTPSTMATSVSSVSMHEGRDHADTIAHAEIRELVNEIRKWGREVRFKINGRTLEAAVTKETNIRLKNAY